MEQTKNLIKEYIGEEISFERVYSYDEYPKIDTLISWMEAQKLMGANAVYLSATTDYDGGFDSVEMQGVIQRYETDEEFSKRISAEKEQERKNRESNQQKERELYEKLKKKFEQP